LWWEFSVSVATHAGVVLIGSAGTGKSHILRAVGSCSGVKTYSLTSLDLIRPLTGQGLRFFLRFWAVVKANQPCIVILDDVHLLAPAEPSTSLHRAVIAGLCDAVDKFHLDNARVAVVASAPSLTMVLRSFFEMMLEGNHETVLPLQIHPSLLRPGRLDGDIELSPPTAQQRVEILKFLAPGVSVGMYMRTMVIRPVHICGYVV
jgi:ATP-dependent 26S proteasome regulatory subunit